MLLLALNMQNDYTPPTTPPAYPYNNQNASFSQPPIPPPPSNEPSKRWLGKAVAIVSTFVIILFTIVGVLVYFGMNAQKEDQADSLISLASVNETVARKPYFDMSFPALPCGPADSGYSADKRQWMQDWITCIDQQWTPIVQAHRPDGKHYVLEPLQFIQSKSEMDGCASATTQVVSAAMYCRENSTIYLQERNLTNSLEEDLSTLFHEYSHHLQLNFMVNIDAELLTKMLYDEELTFPESEQEALSQQNARIEISAECSTLGMMYASGQLNDQAGQRWLQSFNAPSAERTTAGYGSAKAMQKIKAVATTAASMQTCNTWQWPASDLF